MNLLNIILPLLCLVLTAEAERWYSLGNYIEEEGTNDHAGHAVVSSGDGSIIAVAAPHYTPVDDDGKAIDGTRYGRIAIYEFDAESDTWSNLGEEIVGDRGEELGTSLDMIDDGTAIIVGTKAYHENKREAGSVKVYTLTDRNSEEPRWVQKGQTLFGVAAFDRFGYSSAIADQGKVIAVGSPGHDEPGIGDDAGSVTVYDYDTTNQKWEPIQDAPAMVGTHANGRFGHSLSLSQVGNLAVGSPLADDSKGYVRTYKYNATGHLWETLGQDIRGKFAGDKCGTSVAMSRNGDHVIVGSPMWKYNGKKRAGAIIVLKFNGGEINRWKEVGSEIAGEEGDEFGSSVDISDDGEEIAVGSPYSDSEPGKKQTGHITVYHYIGQEWVKRDVNVVGKTEYSNQGSSVALSGNGYQVMGGAPTEGYASVYTLAKTAPPTMSPTEFHERGKHERDHSKGKPKRSGFATFVLVVFLISFIGAGGFLAFKGLVYYRNKRSMAAFQPTPNTDLELRNIEDTNNNDESGGII